GQPIAGNPPAGTAPKTTAVYKDAKHRKIGEVAVYIPFDPALLAKITDNAQSESVQFALVAGGHVLASPNGATGPVTGLRPGVGSASVAGMDVRARAITLLPVRQGGPAYVVATYPEST